jgi:hypothetical protein
VTVKQSDDKTGWWRNSLTAAGAAPGAFQKDRIATALNGFLKPQKKRAAD